MKKFIASILLVLSFSCFVYSQDSENAGQVLMPLEVYVGDRAEIRYTFRSAIDFFSGDKSIEKKELKIHLSGLKIISVS